MATVFGSRVSYRAAGFNGKRLDKEFTGDNHGAAAEAFVAKHVVGLTLDEYRKLPEKERSARILRRVTSPTKVEAVERYCFIKPMWDWHVIEPFSVER